MISGRTFPLDCIQRLWSVERDGGNALGDLDRHFRHIVLPVRFLGFVARRESLRVEKFEGVGWNVVGMENMGDAHSYTRVGWR